MQRKDFKNARVYKRQPCTYFNELAIIVGNDKTEGNIITTATETDDGHLFEEAIDLEDDGGFNTCMDGGLNTPDFDEEFLHSNNYTMFIRKEYHTPTTRRPKRMKPSMTTCLDVICESILNIDQGMNKDHNINVDKREVKQDISSAYPALKAMPRLSRETLIVAYEFFTSKPMKSWGFIEMTEQEREEYVRYKFGGSLSYITIFMNLQFF